MGSKSSTDQSIEARFEGYAILDHGVATIPNLLLKHYVNLGLSDGHFTLLCHIISRKWTRDAPYPTITHLPMSTNTDTRRRYVRELRRKGLIFTARLYWTSRDAEDNPRARPGKLRSNLWYLGNLLHNLGRMEDWLGEGKRAKDFVVEIQQKTIELFLKGELNDTPDEIAAIIQAQVRVVGGQAIPVLLQSLPENLLCENRIVDINNGLLCDFQVLENQVLEKRIVMKKNHDSNKKQNLEEESGGARTFDRVSAAENGSSEMPEFQRVTGLKPAAVHIYRTVVHSWPVRALWQMIDEEIGQAQEDLDFWKQVILAWIGCGWNERNINGMLDYYRRRELPSTNGGYNNGQQTNGRGGQPDFIGEAGGPGDRPGITDEYFRINAAHIAAGYERLKRCGQPISASSDVAVS